MEYGEAINRDAMERAVAIARELLCDASRSLPSAATEAVSRAFCVCVVDGEDQAERRFSDVHRSLIEAVTLRIDARTPELRLDKRARFEAPEGVKLWP